MSLAKRKHMIRTSLIALVLVFICTLAYQAFYTDLKNASVADIERQQRQLATIATGEIEHQFYDLQKRIETAALMPEIRNAQRSESCNQQLQKIVEVNSQELNNLARVSKDGTFICAVNRAIIGESVAKYGNYFEKIAKDPEHKPALSRLITPSGSGSTVIAMHVPVFDLNGHFNGTLGGAIYFDELQKRLLNNTQLSKHSVIALYDNNLDVLYNPDPLIRGKKLDSPEIKDLYEPSSVINELSAIIKKAPSEGTVEYQFRGEKRQAVYKSATIADRYWTVFVIVPFDDIQSSIGRHSARNIFLILCISLIIVTTALAYAWTGSLRARVSRKD